MNVYKWRIFCRSFDLLRCPFVVVVLIFTPHIGLFMPYNLSDRPFKYFYL